MRTAFLVLWLCLPVLVAVAQPATAPALEEFAASAPVVIEEEGDAYVLPLTPSIYGGLADPDLGDMRIFNGDGEAVAHGVRLAPRKTAPKVPPFVPLTLFPLGAPEGEGGAALSVRLDGQGLQASLQVGGGGAQAATKDPYRTYLVDARSLAGVPIERIRLDFEGDAELRGDVRVEVSDDLSSFRTVPGAHGVLRVSAAGETLQRLELEVDGAPARYLRLGLHLTQGASIPLRGVAAQPRAEAEPRPQQTIDLVGRRRADAPHIVDYTLRGPVPVHAVQLRLPQDNSIVPVTLRRHSERDGPGEDLFRGTLFRVGEGAGRVESPPVDVPLRRGARIYQVEFPPSSPEAAAGAPPTLRVFYAPDEVVFLPRGPGPFRLAYGQGRWHAAALPAHTLLEPLNAVPGARVMGASLGLGRPEAGPQALAKSAEIDRTPWLLWAVLGLCVVVLFAMVVHLVRGGRTRDDAGRQV